jgi:mRNA interferase MazF
VVIRRAEVWWALLPSPSGSGPGYPRPVVIVQADRVNASKIQTVIVATMTSNVERAQLVDNVLVKRGEAGLDRTSVINVSQVVTLDRSLLSHRLGPLPEQRRLQLDAGLRSVLGLLPDRSS